MHGIKWIPLVCSPTHSLAICFSFTLSPSILGHRIAVKYVAKSNELWLQSKEIKTNHIKQCSYTLTRNNTFAPSPIYFLKLFPCSPHSLYVYFYVFQWFAHVQRFLWVSLLRKMDVMFLLLFDGSHLPFARLIFRSIFFIFKQTTFFSLFSSLVYLLSATGISWDFKWCHSTT